MTDVELDARITALEDTYLTSGEFCVYFLESHKPILYHSIHYIVVYFVLQKSLK